MTQKKAGQTRKSKLNILPWSNVLLTTLFRSKPGSAGSHNPQSRKESVVCRCRSRRPISSAKTLWVLTSIRH